MSEERKRKRIPYVKRLTPPLDDHLAFVENKSSQRARRIFTTEENITVHLWFDKHYYDRYQHGDDNGKREGIDPDTVERLVKKSIKHLLFYSSTVEGFSFVNHNREHLPLLRAVLQEKLDEQFLNVVIEAHALSVKEFEITVKTAMCIEDFKLSIGQHAIEFQDGSSFLKRKDNNRVVEIYSF